MSLGHVTQSKELRRRSAGSFAADSLFFDPERGRIFTVHHVGPNYPAHLHHGYAKSTQAFIFIAQDGWNFPCMRRRRGRNERSGRRQTSSSSYITAAFVASHLSCAFWLWLSWRQRRCHRDLGVGLSAVLSGY